MINEVLVYTFGSQSHDSVIKAAASFAAQHDADLVGLYVKPDVVGYASIYGTYPLNLVETFYDLQKEFANKAKAQFEKIVRSYNIRSQWHETKEYERKPRTAFYADIAFVSQANKDSGVAFNESGFIDHLITDTGLPTIVIPSDWSADMFAQKPVLGWNETREAANAVRHALPIMRDAKEVDVVTITMKTDLDDELIEGIEISKYLTRHDIKTRYFAERMIEQDSSEADTLLRHVEDRSRDLIIIGGYGHSRLRELVLGGMTRALLTKSPVPVLLVH